MPPPLRHPGIFVRPKKQAGDIVTCYKGRAATIDVLAGTCGSWPRMCRRLPLLSGRLRGLA